MPHFTRALRKRGLKLREVHTVRAIIRGDTLLAVGEREGITRQAVQCRLDAAARKLGATRELFYGIAAEEKEARAEHYRKGAKLGDWANKLYRVGAGHWELTREEAALERAADAILEQAEAL